MFTVCILYYIVSYLYLIYYLYLSINVSRIFIKKVKSPIQVILEISILKNLAKYLAINRESPYRWDQNSGPGRVCYEIIMFQNSMHY